MTELALGDSVSKASRNSSTSMLAHTDKHPQLPQRTDQRESSVKEQIAYLESNLACLQLAQVSLRGTARSHV